MNTICEDMDMILLHLILKLRYRYCTSAVARKKSSNSPSFALVMRTDFAFDSVRSSFAEFVTFDTSKRVSVL